MKFERDYLPYESIEFAKVYLESLGYRYYNTMLIDDYTGLSVTKVYYTKSNDYNYNLISSGKGIGEYAIASGLYEAIEHLYYLNGSKGFYVENLKWDDFKNQKDYKYMKEDYAYSLLENEFKDGIKKIECIKLKSITTDEIIYLPRMYHTITDINEKLKKYCTNNGYASGTSDEESMVHAINEIIERNSVSKFIMSNYIYKNKNYEYLNKDDLSDKIKNVIQSIERDMGIELKLLDVTYYEKFPSFICYSDMMFYEIVPKGFGTSFMNYQLAILRAVMEYYQHIKNYDAESFELDKYINENTIDVVNDIINLKGDFCVGNRKLKYQEVEFKSSKEALEEIEKYLKEAQIDIFYDTIKLSKGIYVCFCYSPQVKSITQIFNGIVNLKVV